MLLQRHDDVITTRPIRAKPSSEHATFHATFACFFAGAFRRYNANETHDSLLRWAARHSVLDQGKNV